jgi:hypothetical protein
MRLPTVLAIFAGSLLAQTGQEGPRAGWPCVPGRAMDRAYLDISESTGGQLVLLQKGEAQHSGIVMSAPPCSCSSPSNAANASPRSGPPAPGSPGGTPPC